MKKIAIIGASYLQEPLIERAKELGYETHVFAWAANDVGEKSADFFYPISIVEKEEILEKCREINVDGICTIASDLAVIVVNYVADKLGLVGNSLESTELSTNKHSMHMAFEANNDPAPKSILVSSVEDIKEELMYPVIVKPLDRSGSRGVYKVPCYEQLKDAIEGAKVHGFIKRVLVEEYVEGREYSVECISYKGQHSLLAITEKYTTGSPHFIETGHVEPADIGENLSEQIRKTVFHALDSLKVEFGASHSEVRIDEAGTIKIIEIGARMGGDFIGSTLVHHSTGIDYVKAVIDIAMGKTPDLTPDESIRGCVGVRYILNESDIEEYWETKSDKACLILDEDIPGTLDGEVTDSASRFGYFIFKAGDRPRILKHMPPIDGSKCDF